MAVPAPTLQWAPGEDWDVGSPTWTNVSGLEALEFERSYGWESGVYQPGSLTATVVDADRTYDPEYAAGAHFGNIVAPGTQFRVIENQGGTDRILWRGFLDRAARSYSPHGRAATTWRCVDLWAMAAPLTYTGTRSIEASKNRATALVGGVGLSSHHYTTTGTGTAGEVLMPARTYANEKFIDVLNEILVAEQGMAWIDREGVMQIAGRFYASKTRMTADQATLSNVAADTSVVRYEAPVVIDYERADIVNSASVTAVGGTIQTYTDATSVARYGLQQAQALADVQVDSDQQAYANAVRMVTMRKDPLARFPPVTFSLIEDSGTEHEHACLRDLWDRVRFKFEPPGGATVIDRDAFIVGIRQSYTSAPGDGEAPWRVTWDLADAAIFDRLDSDNWFVLDSSSLDGSNILGY